MDLGVMEYVVNGIDIDGFGICMETEFMLVGS